MKKWIVIFLIALISAGIWLKTYEQQARKTVLLNVAYDVIRDFYKEYNLEFRQAYKAQQGQDLMISQSHGGASKQTLSVASGLPADVVTLTQSSDVDTLVKKGLVDSHWQQALPNHSVPFGSVMVFLVKKGNPKNIHDWHDLIRDDVSVIFANPKTSANGRFAYLSAYAYAKAQGDEQQAQAFMKKILARVPVLESGARGASISFTQRNLGDVLIAPENEAALAAKALGENSFSVIYPSYTAYTPVYVAEVNANTKINGTHEQAQAYLRNLWSEAAQELAVKHHFRPTNEKILQKSTALFPPVNSFDVNQVFGDWAIINQTHFADNALFDQLYIAAQHKDK
ncbi:sulfate ABC transporter substrate-binding protein [Basfia succiniciproducens]|uniref:sulfate ABC transporter substrate-binding protein n=1 Tax=Basfia succiniciproducens TaxID=653940 RepID=UPI0008C2ED8A|nr:sulfate ABC transporter substrate-binding protein [Basfia succiniciproducens]SEQ82999.1 sulfate transport system substrate-binding protein [Basfia succiniciproducens]